MSDGTKTNEEGKAGVTLVKVSAYRTSDGMLHDGRLRAIRAQALIDLKVWLESNDIAPSESEGMAIQMANEDKALIKLLTNANKGL